MSKIDDFSFMNFIDLFDIVCFQETFMLENVLPSNAFLSFKNYFSPAIKLTKRGRCSGGVIVLVKNKLINFKGCGCHLIY